MMIYYFRLAVPGGILLPAQVPQNACPEKFEQQAKRGFPRFFFLSILSSSPMLFSFFDDGKEAAVLTSAVYVAIPAHVFQPAHNR